MSSAAPICARTKWKGRTAFRLANDEIEVCTLTGGGAIASLRFLPEKGPQSNVLWEAPWPTLDPVGYRARAHSKTYGTPLAGKFLIGFTGHALCLDFFGAPSDEEIDQGLCLHGEAAVTLWRATRVTRRRSRVSLTLQANLPAAGLEFSRTLSLHKGESVVYVSESVRNLRKSDHFFHWMQHVTLGAPFLAAGESSVFLSGTRGCTWPYGYEGKSLLANSIEFTWPEAPTEDGMLADISQPFLRPGTGFVASVLLDASRPVAFAGALNFKLGLVLGYCFPQRIFPWVAIWEENSARENPPWNGRTQARGLEFGTTPWPAGKYEVFRRGSLSEVPMFCRVPALGEIKVSYVTFLAPVSTRWRTIRGVRPRDASILVEDGNGESVEVKAQDFEKLQLTQQVRSDQKHEVSHGRNDGRSDPAFPCRRH